MAKNGEMAKWRKMTKKGYNSENLMKFEINNNLT